MAITTNKVRCFLLPALAIGLLCHPVIDLAADPQIKPKIIDEQDAREALNRLIESKWFLSDVRYLDSLKKRIQTENKEAPIVTSPYRISAPGGHLIGSWSIYPGTNDFAYIEKSADRSELFIFRGQFLLARDNRWTAKINEASATRLTNFFGPREYEKIKVGMTIDEVTSILGAPPGAYFAGEMGFTYPAGRRAAWPFTGTSKEFQKHCEWFFVDQPDVKKDEKAADPSKVKGPIIIVHPFDKAWISNDLAIWISLDEGGRVLRKSSSKVDCPSRAFAANFP